MRETKRLFTVCCVLATGLAAIAQVPGDDAGKVGVEEKLGTVLPLDELKFYDEDGQLIALSALFDRPVVLTLVYYRCPGICTPVLQEVAWVADNCDLVPGQDYRMVTVSFDPEETFELANPKRANMIAEIRSKDVPEDAWRFLTGDAGNINAITGMTGFYYIPDKNEVDYIHAATVVFLSKEGKVVRYLHGTAFNPVDFKMAILDAAQGRERSVVQKISKFCYSYDPEGQAYVLQVNRIILGVTVLFVGAFGVFLLGRSMAGRARGAGEGTPAPQRGETEGAAT